jgi:hypothetical protein
VLVEQVWDTLAGANIEIFDTLSEGRGTTTSTG